MRKENWLAPVSREDAANFAQKYMNIETFRTVDELEDLNYGKFFKIEGFTKDEIITQWGSPKKHISVNLGAYGPIDADQYLETSLDDLSQLFGEDQNLINIYLSWVMLVAEKNAGRVVDGKTYLESFSNACNSHIDLVKSAEIRTIESEADEKKKCVSAFVAHAAPAKTTETVAPQKQ